jgi:intein/homing endonuclease
MRKLNETDCVNISKDYLLGMSYQKLSEKYNICTWSIRNALKKQNIKSRIRKYNCDENYFEKIDTFEKAYWLGLLFADGYVRKRKQFNGKHKQGGIVGISLKNGDEYLLNKFINDLKSNYSLTKQIKDDFLSYKLEINSSKMVDDLIKLGCVPKKSLILLPPKINYDFISHFIRGYFDGDGSIGEYNGRLKLTILGTEEILTWILLFFKNNGMVTTPKISKKNNIRALQINSQTDIDIVKDILYDSCENNYLKRKKEKFKFYD